MGIENIRRWQWVAVSLLVGAGIASWRQHYQDDVPAAYVNSLTDPAQFETALVNREQGLAWFKDLTVYPRRIDGEPIHIVTGMYYDGRPRPDETGGLRAYWYPYFYVAKVPYEPSAGRKTGGTVLTYLDGLAAQGVTYRYAWWDEPGKAAALWMAGSFVIIGLIWPTVLNLLAFGQWRQPKRETIDLSGVRTGSTSAETRGMSAQDFAEVERLGTALEANLTEATRDGGPTGAIEKPESAAAKLGAERLEAATQQEKAEKAFGKEGDDYYPTERRGPGKGE